MTSCQYKIHNMTSCHICIINFVFIYAHPVNSKFNIHDIPTFRFVQYYIDAHGVIVERTFTSLERELFKLIILYAFQSFLT